MPHCIIEITKNLITTIDPEKLMYDVFRAINNIGCFNPNDIKIRIYPVEFSRMGIENQNHSYIATEIQILNNKSQDQVQRIIDSVHNAVQSDFQKVVGKNSITTRISFLDADFYKRNTNYD